MIEDLERILKTHPFLAELQPGNVAFLVGCAKNVRFHAGEYLVKEGQREDTLFLIRQGTVAVEIPRTGGEPICVETIGGGDVIGVSLMMPAVAHLDCRARETVVAFAIDNGCLLRKMDEDPSVGYAITKRLLEHTYQRLARARLQNVDVYR